MNLADAIRHAAQAHGSTVMETESLEPGCSPEMLHVYVSPEAAPKSSTPSVEPGERPLPAAAYEPVNVPEPPASLPTGGAVRMELFLAPEQISSLFKAIVTSNHSVMTLREAASYLRITQAAAEALASAGKIPAFTVDGRWRFPKPAVDEWLVLQSFRAQEDHDVA